MLVAGRPGSDDDARQTVLALQADQVILEQLKAEDEAARPVRHQVAPVLPPGRVELRLDNLEAVGAIGVGQNKEAPVVVADVELVAELQRRLAPAWQLGRAHLSTPVTYKQTVCRPILEK